MIVMAVCNVCLQPYQLYLGGSGIEVELLREIAPDGQHCPCPRLCGGQINIVGDPAIDSMSQKLREPLHLTFTHLYQAVKGMGLPDEIPPEPIVLKALLQQHRVVDCVVEKHGARGVVLHELKLEGGITVHLTSSARGALVLKVTKERPNAAAADR